MIGVGNDLRGDDAAGLVAARRLAKRNEAGIVVVEAPGEGASLIDVWDGADAVLLIDAVRSGSAPGTIHRLPRRALAPKAGLFRQSTHAISIPDAVELAAAIERLPERLTVIGIEGRSFQARLGLSPEVEAALPGAVDAVLREARAMMAPSKA